MSSILRGGGNSSSIRRASGNDRAARSVFYDIEGRPAVSLAASYQDALAEITQARTEADTILADAHTEAARIQEKARDKAQEAYAEAHIRGYTEGREEAEAEAQAAYSDNLDAAVADLRADMEAFCEAVLDEQARGWRDAEKQVKDLALEIAERILKTEVTTNPEVVSEITRHALRRLAGSSQARLRVNPEDVERLRARRDELMALLEGLHSIDILEDRGVGSGGFLFETEGGSLDARIDTTLAEFARALA